MKRKIMIAAVTLMALSLTLPAFGEGDTREVGLLGGADDGEQVSTQHMSDAHNNVMPTEGDEPAGAVVPESEQPQVENS